MLTGMVVIIFGFYQDDTSGPVRCSAEYIFAISAEYSFNLRIIKFHNAANLREALEKNNNAGNIALNHHRRNYA
jgi:hypothetical protein